MATTNFRLRAYAASGTPSEPPINAWPVGYGAPRVDAPPTVNWPLPTAVDGLGRPVGAIGKPSTEFGRNRIDETGYAWYNTFFSGTETYVQVKVNLYDERTQGWSVWTGYMWRPTRAAPVVPGLAGPEYTEFRVRVTELVATTW
jgi:hypothetical protein